MKTKLRFYILPLLFWAAFLSLPVYQTGCATVVALQLKGKMPHVKADELTVKLRWAGVQVGILETTGLHYDEKGVLIAATFHEDLGTPTGGFEVTGKNVEIPGPAK